MRLISTFKGYKQDATHIVSFKLPYPPSVNNYYGRTRTGSVFIKKPGKEFRATVQAALAPYNLQPLQGKLRVWIEVFLPDRRKRDIDNINKALLDALTAAGIWVDDDLVTDLRLVKAGIEKELGGCVVVHIAEICSEKEK
ncbi:RusA family crossover junction endodeoxyribonuclease [Microbulbifer sp. ZKSA002]|uniref:RusA family crossover junction endodeoxyribonuclease n=1 Tax=Microbulbifer sp. ZKSA002 TaxID=3243388 RepID=UPI00403A6D91